MILLILFILRKIHKYTAIPITALGCVVAALILVFLALVCLIGWKCIRSQTLGRKGKVILILTGLYLLAGIWKLSYSLSFEENTIAPMPVAEIPAPEMQDSMVGLVESYFVTKRFPFTLRSMYSYTIRSHAYGVDDSLIQAYVKLDGSDTVYIVSYGRQIERMIYNCWDSYDYLPPPWNGIIIQPQITFSSGADCCIYIYRVDGVLLEPPRLF